jgi:hypothetical protein
MKIKNTVWALECKVSHAPALSKGNYLAFEDIAPKHTFVVIPSNHSWAMSQGIDVVSLQELKKQLDKGC